MQDFLADRTATQ